MPGSVILTGARTPIGKLSGAFASMSAADLGGVAIKGALEKAGISGDDVDYVIMGQVIQAGAGQITARQAANNAGIPMSVPATTINKVCLSGLNAIYLADLMIQSGDADIVVANGLGLEEGMLDALESAADEGVEVVSLAETVTTLAEDQTEDEDHAEEEDHGEEEDHAEEGHEHDHADGDPHFWMDPVRVAEAIEDLALHLAEVDDNATEAEWAARAEVLVAELQALDEEVEEILSVVADDRRVLVTNHDSYDYFADAYEFEVLGTVIPGGGTLAEPSAADLEILVEDIRDAGVTAIFTETTDPSRLAEVVAQEVGEEIAVVQLVGGSLTDADGPAATYADYMRHNATLIADALG
ncbi:MAG: zinc ABC transporter substrate-binding protein [Actinomycetota bacterium]